MGFLSGSERRNSIGGRRKQDRRKQPSRWHSLWEVDELAEWTPLAHDARIEDQEREFK